MTGAPPDVVARRAPAKVNLLLRVLARETSGYHGIETLFCRLALADDLVVERRGDGGSVTIEVDGPDLGPPNDNLAVRAAHLVLAATGRRFGVHLRLTKRIPVGAGLGGGSSDGAAALLAVNQMAGNALPRGELFHLASRLGADVPFLLSEQSLALGWGHGDRLVALPGLPPAPVLLVSPPVAISTAEAYAWVDAAREHAGPRGALCLDLPAVARWSDVARMAGNDFESPVFTREPAVRAAFEAVARTGPLLCRMSGSGSTIFGVYRRAGDLEDARLALGHKLGTVTATETA